jgi:hypothetical protein
MKPTHFIASIALALSGCASSDNVYHTTESYEFTLSPAERANPNEGVKLVSMSRTGRVTIQTTNGIRWRAKQGERFVNDRGGHSYSLKSVDLKTGKVVLEGETRTYYAEGSSKPMMIAR